MNMTKSSLYCVVCTVESLRQRVKGHYRLYWSGQPIQMIISNIYNVMNDCNEQGCSDLLTGYLISSTVQQTKVKDYIRPPICFIDIEHPLLKLNHVTYRNLSRCVNKDH